MYNTTSCIASQYDSRIGYLTAMVSVLCLYDSLYTVDSFDKEAQIS